MCAATTSIPTMTDSLNAGQQVDARSGRAPRRHELSIRNTAPAADAEALADGAWLWHCELWRPLDARPYPDAPYHEDTLEDALLAEMAEMADMPLFPANWRIEEANGRRFLVRPRGLRLPEDMPYSVLKEKGALDIERAVRTLNQRGWALGSDIVLMWDAGLRRFYLYDLAKAHRLTGAAIYDTDDSARIEQFFQAAGFVRLASLRANGRRALRQFAAEPGFDASLQHVYASFSRPLASLWAGTPAPWRVMQVPLAGRTGGIERQPYTWVFSSVPLAEDACRQYELTWAWSPVFPQIGLLAGEQAREQAGKQTRAPG